KILATDTLNSGADLLMQLLGGRGYMENNLAPQIFRDARVLSIGEGPNEALAARIGRNFRQDDRVPGFFKEQLHDGDAADMLIQARGAVERNVVSAGPYPASSLRVWQDGVLGRLVLGALELAAARKIADRDGSPAIARWAGMRFELLQSEIAGGFPAMEGALSV